MIAALGAWDWAFVAWFLLVTTGVGLWYARRAGRDLSEYFLSGRNLPWWALGTSMVATTFAADTPIVVAEFVAKGGIANNWVWWSFLFGGTLTVFLFSRWWRRSEVFTEVEIVALRYDGAPAKLLRGFKAVYLGLVANAIVIGWVTAAMVTVVDAVFGEGSSTWAIAGLLGLAVAYSALSGLWGVVATDVLQFAMALIGAILLAVLSVDEVGGLGEMVHRVEAVDPNLLAIVPTGWDAFMASVMVLALVNWWAVYYPGAEPGGGGYIAQRMFAAKDENHARGGTLWFIVAHYVVRPWPWIVVGLCAIALEPGYATEELEAKGAYASMFRVLPAGVLGLVVASFFAAFISTITTQLTLASSYLVNDLYLPFIAKAGAAERQRVRVARLAVVLVVAAGATVAYALIHWADQIGKGWTILMELTAGSGLVLIVRWLWWRVNAWSEIAAMLTSAVVCATLYTEAGNAWLVELAGDAESPLVASYRLLTIVGITVAVSFAATLLTRPVAVDHLRRFYERVRPGGFWGPMPEATGVPVSSIRRDLAMWGWSSLMVLGALLGIGSVVLLRPGQAAVCLGAAGVGGFMLVRMMRAR